MSISSVNNFQYNNYSTANVYKGTSAKNGMQNPSVNSSLPSFCGAYTPSFSASKLRTEFISKDEKNKYTELTKIVDKDTKKQLHALLKSGALLNSDSNDNSTTLDNLYKIATTKRAEGLNNIVLLKETISEIADPHLITQQFGNIPREYKDKLVTLYVKDNPNFRPTNLLDKRIAEYEVSVEHSGTCVASSIEFNLAQKHPAEFARFAEGLSSPSMSVNKTISLNNLADNTLDAIWLLNAFEIPYETKGFDKADLKFAPDKNAIVKAHIQTIDKDPLERSSLDVLMQSTFMQVGSQQSYNSLTDKRAGKFNQNDKGLIEFEKTFTESVVEDKNKISVTYQTVDENAKLIGYETDFNTMKKQILDSLSMGENVIIGYTQVDDTNTIINGHEITIIGTRKDNNGKLIFICNDTDDNVSKPIEYPENYLLPKIHHAALPQAVLKDDVNFVENWAEGLKTYKELKKENQYKKMA